MHRQLDPMGHAAPAPVPSAIPDQRDVAHDVVILLGLIRREVRGIEVHERPRLVRRARQLARELDQAIVHPDDAESRGGIVSLRAGLQLAGCDGRFDDVAHRRRELGKTRIDL
jgi:hypothetical protein